MVPVPGVELLAARQPNEEELMLEEEVKAKRLMDGTVSEDEDEMEEEKEAEAGESDYEEGEPNEADY